MANANLHRLRNLNHLLGQWVQPVRRCAKRLHWSKQERCKELFLPSRGPINEVQALWAGCKALKMVCKVGQVDGKVVQLG